MDIEQIRQQAQDQNTKPTISPTDKTKNRVQLNYDNRPSALTLNRLA